MQLKKIESKTRCPGLNRNFLNCIHFKLTSNHDWLFTWLLWELYIQKWPRCSTAACKNRATWSDLSLLRTRSPMWQPFSYQTLPLIILAYTAAECKYRKPTWHSVSFFCLLSVSFFCLAHMLTLRLQSSRLLSFNCSSVLTKLTLFASTFFSSLFSDSLSPNSADVTNTEFLFSVRPQGHDAFMSL